MSCKKLTIIIIILCVNAQVTFSILLFLPFVRTLPPNKPIRSADITHSVTQKSNNDLKLSGSGGAKSIELHPYNALIETQSTEAKDYNSFYPFEDHTEGHIFYNNSHKDAMTITPRDFVFPNDFMIPTEDELELDDLFEYNEDTFEHNSIKRRNLRGEISKLKISTSQSVQIIHYLLPIILVAITVSSVIWITRSYIEKNKNIKGKKKDYSRKNRSKSLPIIIHTNVEIYGEIIPIPGNEISELTAFLI